MTALIFIKNQLSGYSFKTKAYDQTQLICVTSGSLYFSVQKRDPECLRAGYSVLLRKGSSFSLFCREEGYRGIGVIPLPPAPEAFSGVSIANALDVQLEALLRTAREHLAHPAPESEPILQALASALLWQTLASARGQDARSRQDCAAATRTAIDAHLASGTTLKRILSALPIGYRQISRQFSARYGMSPKQYQEYARIREACRLIEDTRLSMTDIALELGYSSSQHFATKFSRATGHPPTWWRKHATESP